MSGMTNPVSKAPVLRNGYHDLVSEVSRTDFGMDVVY